MITPANVINEFNFINQSFETTPTTIVAPSGQEYTVQRIDAAASIPGLHLAPMRCRELETCMIFVFAETCRITKGSKEFVVDGRLAHTMRCHPERLTETVLQQLKSLMTP